jgi:hypothetical protein
MKTLKAVVLLFSFWIVLEWGSENAQELVHSANQSAKS